MTEALSKDRDLSNIDKDFVRAESPSSKNSRETSNQLTDYSGVCNDDSDIEKQWFKQFYLPDASVNRIPASVDSHEHRIHKTTYSSELDSPMSIDLGIKSEPVSRDTEIYYHTESTTDD